MKNWTCIKYFLAALNFIAAIASIVGLILSVTNENTLKTIIFSLVLAILCAAIFSICAVFHADKCDKMTEVTKYSQSFHKILHCLRDLRIDLDKIIDENTYQKSSDFRHYITTEMLNVTKIISSSLSEATGCKIRVCIKVFDFIRSGEEDVNRMQLITLARSNVDNVRNMLKEHYRKIQINENTDFEKIFYINEGYVEEREHYFYKEDLIKYEKELKKMGEKYKNSNINWRKEYNATVVLPIRCYISPEENQGDAQDSYYDIVGFLCIDSKDRNVFDIKKRGFIIEYLKGISDILYIYIEDIIYYHKLIKEEEPCQF